MKSSVIPFSTPTETAVVSKAVSVQSEATVEVIVEGHRVTTDRQQDAHRQEEEDDLWDNVPI